jgi:hypothetical protein
MLAAMVATSAAATTRVSREQDITSLRLGQRVFVDDGSCPSGQIKEVTGARLSSEGVVRTQKCVPRAQAR